MAKRDEFDDFFDDDEAPVLDTRADGRLMRVPLARMSPNRVNPRTDFGAPEQLEELGNSLRRRQIQAVPVVSRAAYLKLWPDHEKQVGDVDVVIVSGERRYRAANAVAMPALEVVLNDGVAESRKTFMDAVVSENVDRQNFDPIEEALAVEALVETFGSGREVAQHFKRADGWVSQRRILLHLASEMQELVRARALPVEPARKLAKLARDGQWSAERQLGWWQEQQEQRARAAAERKAGKQQPASVLPGVAARPPEEPTAPPDRRGVAAPAAAAEVDPGPERQAPVGQTLTAMKPSPPPETGPAPVPAARPSAPASRAEEREPLPAMVTADAVPWGDPRAVARLARRWMSEGGRRELAKFLTDDLD